MPILYMLGGMIRSESRSMVLTISSKSREFDDLASAQDKEPVPLVFRNWPDEPSALGKVYLMLFNTMSPDMLAVPENEAVALTSRSPEIRRSFDDAM